MKVFGKVRKKNWIIQAGHACKRCCSAGPHPVFTSAQRRWSLVLPAAGSAMCCPPPCQRPCLDLAREFFFQFCDEASHSFMPGSDCRTLVLFSKLAARPLLKTPARRLLDVTVARRTCASKTLEKKEGVPRWNQCWTLWARQIGASSAWFYSLAWSVFAERSRSFEAATGTPLAKQRRVSANCA